MDGDGYRTETSIGIGEIVCRHRREGETGGRGGRWDVDYMPVSVRGGDLEEKGEVMWTTC